MVPLGALTPYTKQVAVEVLQETSPRQRDCPSRTHGAERTTDTRCSHLTVVAALRKRAVLTSWWSQLSPLPCPYRTRSGDPLLSVSTWLATSKAVLCPPGPAAIKTVKLSASRPRRPVATLFDPILGCPGNRNTAVLLTVTVDVPDSSRSHFATPT